jgi:ZIP family zinc transporter
MAWLAIPFAAMTMVSTFAGGLVALRFARWIHTLIALSGGVVVAVALFEILPEAMELTGDPQRVGTLVGAGFVAAFLAERALVLHHRDAPDQARAHANVGVLGAFGLSVHSFLDGLAIGLAFGLDEGAGILVFVAVVGHDFADGFNTVTFIISQQHDRRRALRWLAIDSAAPLIGAIVGSMISVSDATLGQILAAYAGFFLFMGATDLLPEAHEHASFTRVALTLAGFGSIFLLTTLVGHH